MNSMILLRFDKLKAETPKAILVKVLNDEFWLPKKICRRLIVNNKLGGNIEIPKWLYIEKFNKNPPKEDYIIQVVEVTPKKVLFNPNEPIDESLIK